MTVVVVGFVVKWLLRMYEFLFLWWAWAEFLNFCFPSAYGYIHFVRQVSF